MKYTRGLESLVERKDEFTTIFISIGFHKIKTQVRQTRKVVTHHKLVQLY